MPYPTIIHADCQVHTLDSDGSDSRGDIAEKARDRGIVAWVTDHDVFLEERVQGLRTDSLELNVQSAHIGAYGIELRDETARRKMLEYQEAAKQRRRGQYEGLCRRLEKCFGIPVVYERDVLTSMSRYDNPQRLHVLDWLVRNEHVRNWQVGLEMIKQRIPGRERMSIEEGIDFIHKYLNAVAVELHPLMRKPQALQRALDHGLDGVEYWYTYFQHFHSRDDYEQNPKRTISEALEMLSSKAHEFGVKRSFTMPCRSFRESMPKDDYDEAAGRFNDIYAALVHTVVLGMVPRSRAVLITGGSDYHGEGKPDIKLGACGLTHVMYSKFLREMEAVKKIRELYPNQKYIAKEMLEKFMFS